MEPPSRAIQKSSKNSSRRSINKQQLGSPQDMVEQTPDREYIMSRSWAEILKRQTGPRQAARNALKHQIDLIAHLSETRIQMPGIATNKLLIWGTEEQCNLAATQLDTWQFELQTQSSKRRENQIWEKNHAYHGRKEHRNMQASYENFATEFFKDIDDSNFPFEAYLIWPTSYDLDAYLNTFEDTTLKQISTTFRCHFHHEKSGKLRYTRIRSQNEERLLAAYQRLIGLAKEMVSGKHREVAVNYFQMPAQEDYRIKTKVVFDASRKYFTATLHGDPKDDMSQDDWQRLVYNVDRGVRKAVINALTVSLSGLHMSESYVRLRVEFGHLGLKSFQRSADGSNIYDTDKFIEMVQNPRTRLSECALECGDGDIFRLVEVLNGMPEFFQPEEVFRVCYDFQEPGKNLRTRLETDLVRGYDPGEVDIRGQRWLLLQHHGESQTLLNLKVLNLIQPSFAIQITNHDLIDQARVTEPMSRFQNAHTFKPSSNGLRDFLRRRSVIPPGHKELVAVTEMTIYKARVKDLNGTFELRREDFYDHRDGKTSPFPISSRWVASYYYLGWDVRFDEFANIRPGEDISWHRELTSLFPKYLSEKDASLLLAPKFSKFWDELKMIQKYLTIALSRLPQSEETSPVSQW